MNDDILDATGLELGAARGKAASTIGSSVEECLELLRELRSMGIEPKQYDLASPWERTTHKSPIFRCGQCSLAYHPDESPYHRTNKKLCPRCRSGHRTWIIVP